ncbi:MAG: hypothetical protein LAP85_07140 [Acidobacteriia bacterium]|nr:hypothetical protein [Terriglobia bacterium]
MSGRGLAGAVRPRKGIQAAVRNQEIQVVQRLEPSVDRFSPDNRVASLLY